MAAPFEEMGHELKIYVGTAGSAATEQVETATDIDYSMDPQKAPTTDRGTGAPIPITTENVVQRGVTITWTMNNDHNDTKLATLIAATVAGEAFALKLVTASNATIFDGDVTASKKYNAPLAGPGTYDFSATPTKKAGRKPTLG